MTEVSPSDLSLAPLDTAIVLQIQGKDCERYLNNRLSNNIKQLVPNGPGIFAAALSVQGKTEGLFYVSRLAAGSFVLLADCGNHENVLQALTRYKVADRVEFINLSHKFKCIHIFSSNLSITEVESKILSLENVKSNLILVAKRNRFGSLGLDLILDSKVDLQKTFSELNLIIKTLSTSEQIILRLRAKIPSFPNEIGPDYLLQESNLEGCYSTGKGCYVGQEVIQKIASFATLPGRLVAFECEDKLDSSQTISDESNAKEKIANVISSAFDRDSNRSYGFMRVKSKAIAADGLEHTKAFAGTRQLRISSVFDFTKS